MSDREKLVLPDDFSVDWLPKGTFSHSQYNQFKKCGQAYYYKYIEGLPSQGTSSLAKGRAIHRMVETALKSKRAGKIATLAEVRAMADTLVQEETKNIVFEEGEDVDGLKQSVVDGYAEYHTKALAKIDPIAIEEPFAVKVGDVPMVGYIDLIDAVPAAPLVGLSKADADAVPRTKVVVDLKTTTKTWTQDQVDSNPQLTLYAHVIGTTSVRIDQLVQLKSGMSYRPVSSVRTQADVDNYIEDLDETTRLIKAGIFPKTALDGWACGRCEYWSICRGRNKK